VKSPILAKDSCNFVWLRGYLDSIQSLHTRGGPTSRAMRRQQAASEVCFSNLKKHNGLVLLPLSPSKLFVAANDELGLSKIRQMPTRDIVKNMNTFVAGRARKFVWSADRSQENFLKKHMSKELEALPLFPNLDAVETPAVAKES